MSQCLFCQIINHELNATIVYEDEHVVAFNDINPQAPTHILVIPKRHIVSLDHGTEDDAHLLGRLMLVAKEVAAKDGRANGYRVVTNIGPAAGQTVLHFHLHVLGGRPMSWPPG